MPRQPQEIRIVHASADYYEPLLRARFVRGMQKLQEQASINKLAMALSSGNLRQASSMVTPSRVTIEQVLMPLKKVLIDAFMRGGKLGADHLMDMLHG